MFSSSQFHLLVSHLDFVCACTQINHQNEAVLLEKRQKSAGHAFYFLFFLLMQGKRCSVLLLGCPAGGLCQGKVPGALWHSGPAGPARCCACSNNHPNPKGCTLERNSSGLVTLTELMLSLRCFVLKTEELSNAYSLKRFCLFV